MRKPRQCWAHSLGDCKGPLTGEHIVSSCLFGEFVKVEGLLDGPPKSIGKAGLVVNALCKAHNNRLSECDQAAKDMSEAADWMFATTTPRDSPTLVLPVSGFRFGKWMAKTACNHAVREHLAAPEEWVRFAFADKDDRSIGVYFVRSKGDPRPFPKGHYKWTWTGATLTDLGVATCFYFNGLMSVVATVPVVENLDGVRRYYRQVAGVDAADIVSRPDRVKVWDGPALRGTIEFLW
jgi:hypothetical protein